MPRHKGSSIEVLWREGRGSNIIQIGLKQFINGPIVEKEKVKIEKKIGGGQSFLFLVQGCLSSSFLRPIHSTPMPMLPKPSGLTLIVYYIQGIRGCALRNMIYELSPIFICIFYSVHLLFMLLCFEPLFCVGSLDQMARDIAKVLGFWPTIISSLGPNARDITKVLRKNLNKICLKKGF